MRVVVTSVTDAFVAGPASAKPIFCRSPAARAPRPLTPAPFWTATLMLLGATVTGVPRAGARLPHLWPPIGRSALRAANSAPALVWSQRTLEPTPPGR